MQIFSGCTGTGNFLVPVQVFNGLVSTALCSVCTGTDISSVPVQVGQFSSLFWSSFQWPFDVPSTPRYFFKHPLGLGGETLRGLGYFREQSVALTTVLFHVLPQSPYSTFFLKLTKTQPSYIIIQNKQVTHEWMTKMR